MDARRNLGRTSVASVLALASTPAFAGGFALEHQNAQALGVAFAGAETHAGDSGFAANNPASIAGLARGEFSISATAIKPVARYRGASATLLGAAPVVGRDADNGVISNAVVPNISVAFPVTDRLSIGLVANATFGFKTSFEEDSIVRYQARTSDLKVIEATPVIAYELSPSVRLGAGLRVQRLDLSLTSTIDAGGVAAASLVPGFAPGSSDLQAAFDVEDVAIGFTVGMQTDLTPRLHAGAAYSSKVDHSLDGDAAFDLATSPAAQILNAAAGLFEADGFTSDFATPAIAAGGLRYEASERLTLLASTKVIFWSSFDNVSLEFNDAATPTEVVTQNWRDSWSVSAGAEFAADSNTRLRAGVMYDESPVNSEFASPRIPDGARHWIAAGVTQDFSERVSADLGVAYAYFSNRRVALDGADPENLFRGSLAADFSTEAYAASLRIRYKL